jgi:lipopolysaccharide export system protein LptA
MLAKKQTVLFFLFIGICVSLVLISLMGQWDGGVFKDIGADDKQKNSMQESYFKDAKYHLLKDDVPSFNLTSDELTINSTTEKIFFIKPRGFAFTSANERIDYEGDHGFFNQSAEVLVLEQNTKVNMNVTSADAKKLTYQMKEDRVHLENEVKTKTLHEGEGDWIYVNSDEAYFWPQAKRSRYVGHVEGEIDRKRVYEDSLSFSSYELLLNMVDLKADLNENVVMKKRYLTATSRRGEIFLENYNKKLKYFALYDDVKVVEKVMLDGKFIERKAFSEKLEGLPSESKIILTGYPKVYQLNDVIKGNKIVLREKTEVVEVDDANTKFKVE